MVGRRACGPARSKARAAHRSCSQASVLSARRRKARDHTCRVQQVRLAGGIFARRPDRFSWCGSPNAQLARPPRRTGLQQARLALGSLRRSLRRADRRRAVARPYREGCDSASRAARNTDTRLRAPRRPHADARRRARPRWRRSRRVGGGSSAVKAGHPALLERQDCTLVAWYRSIYAPRTGGGV